MDRNKLVVSLKIFDFNYQPERLTEKLRLEPSNTFLKGDTYFLGQIKIPKVSNYNYWEYSLNFTVDKNLWIQNVVDQFIKEIIRPRTDLLIELSYESNLELYVAHNSHDDYHPSLHFKKEDISLLGKIGLELDLDLWNI